MKQSISRRWFCASLTATAVTTLVSSPALARTQLTKSEVQAIIIDKPWRNRKGTYLFRSNGTYTYTDKKKTYGPVNYKFHSDGSITCSSAVYTFYRTRKGTYEYQDSRTKRFSRVRH
ncbi:MAG: hypothetical protein AAGF25_00505 [Pseudomonadota bacterium]